MSSECKKDGCAIKVRTIGGSCAKHAAEAYACAALGCTAQSVVGKRVCIKHGGHEICNVYACQRSDNGRGVCNLHDTAGMAQEDDAKDDPEEEHNEARNVVEDLEEEHAEAAIAMSSAEEEAFMMAEDGDEEVAAENESVAVKPAAETKVAAPLVVGNEAMELDQLAAAPSAVTVANAVAAAQTKVVFNVAEEAATTATSHECCECGKEFASLTKLARHAVVHAKKKKWSCETCGASFSKRSALTFHLSSRSSSSRCTALPRQQQQHVGFWQQQQQQHVAPEDADVFDDNEGEEGEEIGEADVEAPRACRTRTRTQVVQVPSSASSTIVNDNNNNNNTGIPTSFKSSAGERSRRAIATHVSARAAAEQQSLGRASRRHARVQPGAQEPAAMLTELEGTPPPSPPPPPPPPSVAVVAPTTVGDGTVGTLKLLCSTADCSNATYGRGLCKNHGARGLNTAAGCSRDAVSSSVSQKHTAKHTVPCSLPGCTNIAVKAGGVCVKHGAHGFCTAAGCTAGSVGRGVCSKHKPKIKSTCSTLGCSNTGEKQGLCRKHGAQGFCATAGCNAGAIRRGFCYRHTAKKVCTRLGCTTPANSKGLCVKHGGDDRKQCRIGGCKTLAQVRGLCGKHGAHGWCEFDGCTTSAQAGFIHCITHGNGKIRKPCSEPGCTTGAVNKGLCSKHGGDKGECKIIGCTNKMLGRLKVCTKHGGKGHCQHPSGCATFALKMGGFCTKHTTKVLIL